jgi:hypothetical protein
MSPSGKKVPGDYVGNGEASAPMHNDRYDFSDEAIPYETPSIGDRALLGTRMCVRYCRAPPLAYATTVEDTIAAVGRLVATPLRSNRT